MDVHTVTAAAESFTCNAYLVPGERTTMVDVGTYHDVINAIRDHVETIDAVVLTHQHGDHVDRLSAVSGTFGPEIYAFADHPLRTRTIVDGDEVLIGDETFEVVHTPGHADDHVSFVSDETLFSGDVVVHDDGAFDDGSFGRTDLPGQSRETLVESIETLLDRMPDSVEHMYAGHGGEFHGDVRAIVERALERAARHEPKYPDK
ncbi:MBL fold metallo-hydrolase [Halovivax cerinus]|uniref:MBL fold metallo-hydrolase n=1 Tax=Halovivax cerinus TaxID=1487865 RepID=A0ABD5NS76_9EURY|nr:MBL fold metallo-hydrolase [Halovivax cerinus]